MASSQGELTVQLETRTLRQQSMSMPSRLVSMVRLSRVTLSTPVARKPKWPPLRMLKSRRMTLRQFLRAMALLPTPGSRRRRGSRRVPGPADAEALAPDEAGAGDGDVVEVFAPDEGVVPVVVAVVLEVFEGAGLGVVVGATPIAGGLTGEGRVCREDGAAAGEIELDIVAQADGEADVGAGGEEDDSAAGCCDGVDGLVDGGRVDGLAVASGAVGAYVGEHGDGLDGASVEASAGGPHRRGRARRV